MEAQQSTVLVVSNRESCGKLYYHNLLKRGVPTLAAASPHECVLFANLRPITAIVLCHLVEAQDIHLEQYRYVPELADIPIVLISLSTPDPAWMARWNIVGYLPHPASIPQLIQCLTLLERAADLPSRAKACNFPPMAYSSTA
jgi:hypothetical protein